jgi:glycosyltransferase involved in cell wall biosynthesis
MSLAAGSVTALPARRPDLVVAVMPTLAAGVVGSFTAAARGSRFAVIFQDLQGRAAEQTGISGGARIAHAVGEIERQIARRADVVGVVAESFRPFLSEGGVPSDRVHRFRNWSEFSEPTEPVVETRNRFGWREDEFVCLHAGNMGQKQGLDNVLNAAALPGLDGVKFVLAGDGNEREALERGAGERGLRNIQFVDMQPMGGPCEAMCRAADVLLVNQRAAVLDMSLPSKLTTYFAAGRPVIAAVHRDGETASELQASAAGMVVAPEDPAALRDALREAASGSWDTAAFADAGAAYARRVLSREAALAHLADVLLARPAERCAAPGGATKSLPSLDAP